MELFSRMSTEALQAIDETRQEMNKKNIKENITESCVPADEGHITPTSPDQSKQVTGQQKSDDNDSAIGTSSLRSHPLVNVETEVTHPRQPTPPSTPPDRARSQTVCAFHTITDDEIKQRHESRHPSFQPSQFAQDCIKKHLPFATPTNNKKLSVFERLSAPAPISYKPTARQRTRARLSLSLSVNNDKGGILAFGQRKEQGYRREGLKSAFPTILRTQRKEEYTKPKAIPNKTTTKNSQPADKAVNQPTISTSYAKLEIAERQPTPPGNSSSKSSKTGQGKPLHTQRQFQITPMGYDSRYMALKYDQPLYTDNDFDELEWIEHSKMKCQQWLAHQTILGSS